MPLVMVPVPEEHVPEVMSFVARLEARESGHDVVPSPPPLPECFGHATAWVEKIIQSVSPDQYERSAPYANVTVHTLMNALIGDLRAAATTLRREELPEGLRDVEYDDLAAAYTEAAAVLRAAMAEPASLGGTVSTREGEVPAQFFARFALAGHLVGGWELALATDQDAPIPPSLAEIVGGIARQVVAQPSDTSLPEGEASEDDSVTRMRRFVEFLDRTATC